MVGCSSAGLPLVRRLQHALGCLDGSSTDVLLTRDNNYFNNVYITVALSPGGIISGWYSVVLTALYH